MQCTRFTWVSLIGLLGLLGGPVQGQIPWVMPWDDSLPGVTDLSALNSPIGSDRVQVDTNGHFVVGQERIRFLGVNFAGDSPFMPTNNAEGVAARLAKLGINNVRFHHMDAPWAYGGGLLAYTNSTSTNFNPAQLERLHFLVARLKAHGIYANINLLVGRQYRSADGLGPEVTAMDWKDQHILGCFYAPALGLQMDYATKLLGATNRFTGLPLARDPAVAFVEIINENGLLQKWYEGSLDGLPATYATALQGKWNQWLQLRYAGSETAMLNAWGVVNEALGTNHLRNGAFTNLLANWNAEQHAPARAAFSRTYDFTNSQPCARVMVTNTSTESWHIQLNQAGLKVVSNQVYTVSFWAKADVVTNMDVAFMRAHADYATLGYSQRLNLTTNWLFFAASYQSPVTETNARVNFGGMGTKLASFYFADARFQAGGQVGILPAGSSLAGGTVPVLRWSGSGYVGTREARRDWLRFLMDLEHQYYADMVGHLRTNLGYAGLIFGTIMANSPASVQSRLDVVDGHAYWKHPAFPGQPWDPVNWTVSNVSMVNTLGSDNTLAGLARQRIKGKPFTVTEYQHPSPNYYGAEGVLLLAAYGALQDWDGLWFFDYGHGNPVPGVNLGMVRSYFDMGQHPTKLVNLPLAAFLFRRGDVGAAKVERTMALPLEKELDLLEKNASQWNVFSSSQMGMPARFAFVNRLSTSLGTNGLQVPPPDPNVNTLAGDTGELRWNASVAGQGLVTINTPRTRGLVGVPPSGPVNLGDISVSMGSNRLGWCTFGVTLRQGEVFTNDCTLLAVTTGWSENTGQVWKDANKDSVGNQWGGPPVLAEVVPFALHLPAGTNAVRAWSLDARGQRRASLSVSGTATNATITVSTNDAALWFEIQVARWTASYDLWRLREYSGVELAQGEVSGPAAPSGPDGIPNLLRYYLGSRRGEMVPPLLLPSLCLVESNDQTYLGMSCHRDSLVTDVEVLPEISSNLVDWVSGPAHTVQEPEVVLGSRSLLTWRSVAPVGSLAGQFLRLRFSLKPF